MTLMSNMHHEATIDKLEYLAQCIKDSNLANLEMLREIVSLQVRIHDMLVDYRDWLQGSGNDKADLSTA